MPPEFVVQRPDVANPPTLFLPLAAAAARLRAPAPAGLGQEAARAEARDRSEDLAFLRAGAPGPSPSTVTPWRHRAHVSQVFLLNWQTRGSRDCHLAQAPIQAS